mgnify:CR=1 FL=1
MLFRSLELAEKEKADLHDRIKDIEKQIEAAMKGEDKDAGRDVILMDDVLYTGRTIRAALGALFEKGRADRVQLLVLIRSGETRAQLQSLLVVQQQERSSWSDAGGVLPDL